MVAAELQARLTAARAVLGDYRRAIIDGLDPGNDAPDWTTWAQRLGIALGEVLSELTRTELPAAEPEPGKLAAICGVLLHWDAGNMGNREAVERIDQIAAGTRVESGPELGGGAYLTGDDLGAVLAALTDAARWHEYRASLKCVDCAAHPAELCDDHGAGLDAAAAYQDLAGRIGGER